MGFVVSGDTTRGCTTALGRVGDALIFATFYVLYAVDVGSSRSFPSVIYVITVPSTALGRAAGCSFSSARVRR